MLLGGRSRGARGITGCYEQNTVMGIGIPARDYEKLFTSATSPSGTFPAKYPYPRKQLSF